MIKNILVTGDCHRRFNRLYHIPRRYKPEETAIILLGDVCINYFLHISDEYCLKKLNKLGYILYCVHGNHEERPINIPNMVLEYDDDVNNYVWVNLLYPNVRFLADGYDYKINNKTFTVFSGAYSVDKEYRLMTGRSWFESEQLSVEDMNSVLENAKGESYDYIFSHTCPYSWRPIDQFLPGIDQSKVDTRTEEWLEKLRRNVDFKHWFCGHWHIYREIEQYNQRGTFLYGEVYDLNKDDVIFSEV